MYRASGNIARNLHENRAKSLFRLRAIAVCPLDAWLCRLAEMANAKVTLPSLDVDDVH